MIYLLLIIIIIIIIILLLNYSHEYFIDNIFFINGNNLEKMLIDDDDKYYDRFYSIDWKARNVIDKYSYIDKIKKNKVCIDWDYKNKQRIINIINRINKINKNKNILSIPWKIGLTTGKIYEGGLPHTRNDVIIISTDIINNYSDNNLIKLLIHEKVHIFQKLYPNETKQYISKFKILRERNENDMIRVNPDTNNYIYINDDKEILQTKYNSSNPSSILDVNTMNQNKEHPYEWMAIDISDKFMEQ